MKQNNFEASRFLLLMEFNGRFQIFDINSSDINRADNCLDCGSNAETTRDE